MREGRSTGTRKMEETRGVREGRRPGTRKMEEARGVREGRRPRYKEDGGDARSERGKTP